MILRLEIFPSIRGLGSHLTGFSIPHTCPLVGGLLPVLWAAALKQATSRDGCEDTMAQSVWSGVDGTSLVQSLNPWVARGRTGGT